MGSGRNGDGTETGPGAAASGNEAAAPLAPPPPPPPQPGQWVWVATAPGAGDPAGGTWMWSPTGAQPAPLPTRKNTAGRAGLFVGGYFALGLVQTMFWMLASIFVSEDGLGSGSRIGWVVVSGIAAGFVAGLLWIMRKWRTPDLEPLAVMAAFGSFTYAGIASGGLAYGVGLDGFALFWSVVLVAVPFGLATMFWMPHPFLGLNVGFATAAAVIAAPLGSAEFIGPAKALLLGAVLASLALVVDVRTRSRAGSLLHYFAVVALAVAKVWLAGLLDPVAAIGIVSGLAYAELLVAIVMKRRSWSYSAWITIELLLVALVVVVSPVPLSFDLLGWVAPVVIVGAVVLQRREEAIRNRILAGLPPDVAARMPA